MTSDVVQRAQAGDDQAFEHLIRASYDRLFATAHHILRDRDAADDAVQDAIVRCWRDIRGLRDPDRFEAWLYRLLVNACRDHARRARRHPKAALLDAVVLTAGDDYAALVEHDALEQAFLALSADHRVVLVLAHYVGYSAPEIANCLGIPPGTVYSRLHYAVRAMRSALSPASTPGSATTESPR